MSNIIKAKVCFVCLLPFHAQTAERMSMRFRMYVNEALD